MNEKNKRRKFRFFGKLLNKDDDFGKYIGEPKERNYYISDDDINYLNNETDTWKKLNYIRTLLGNRFHMSVTTKHMNEYEWVLYYGNDDIPFYFTDYCKPIMDSEHNSLKELIDFTIQYKTKRWWQK